MTRAKKPVRKTKPAVQQPAPPAHSAAPPAAAAPAPAPTSAPAGLRLEASCTLRDSIDLQFQLLAVDFGESDALVDGSAVERVDTAGLQMLLAFVRHQSARGRSVRWTAVSPELLRSSQLLGVAQLLGMSDATVRSDARGN